MKDLYKAIDALNAIVNEGPGDGPNSTPNVAYKNIGDMIKAIKTPGRQGAADPEQSAKNIAAANKPRTAAVSPTPGVGRQDGPAIAKPAAFTNRPDDAPKPAPIAKPAPARAMPADQAAAMGAAAIAAAPKSATPPAASIQRTPTVVPKPKPAEPVAAPKPAGGERVTYQSLAKASGIADPNKIRPGQEIKLPGGGTYKVQKGDTLSGIAQNVRLGNIGAPKPAPKPAATTTARAGDTPQQSGGAGGEFGPGTTRTASTTSATPRQVSTVRPPAKPAAKPAATPAAADDMMSPDDMMMQPAAPVKRPSMISQITRPKGDGTQRPDLQPYLSRNRNPQQSGPSLSDVTAAGNARFGDPMQRARDAVAAQQQTTPLQGSGKQIPANIQKKIDARRADIANRYELDADGNYSLANPPRQPGDAAPTTRTDTNFRASDGTNTVARDASGNLNVRQRVTDPDAKAALVAKVNRAREMQRLALAAGSTDPDDIRAYVNRMNRTQGTGVAGGTDPNTF